MLRFEQQTTPIPPVINLWLLHVCKLGAYLTKSAGKFWTHYQPIHLSSFFHAEFDSPATG
jgi:hypothetical protein